MQWIQGGVAELTAEFRDNANQLMDVDNPQIDIIREVDDVAVAIDQVPLRTSLGEYTLMWNVPQDAEVGWYRAEWTAFNQGVEMGASEMFEVVTFSGGTILINDIESLRRRLNDVIPAGGTDADTFFTNNELHTLLAKYNGSANGASWEGWMIRSGSYSELIDMNTSGSERALSDKFDHASKLARMYFDMWKREIDTMSKAGRPRVTGKTFSLDETASWGTWGPPNDPEQTPFLYGATDHVRVYALKRFPAVIG